MSTHTTFDQSFIIIHTHSLPSLRTTPSLTEPASNTLSCPPRSPSRPSTDLLRGRRVPTGPCSSARPRGHSSSSRTTSRARAGPSSTMRNAVGPRRPRSRRPRRRPRCPPASLPQSRVARLSRSTRLSRAEPPRVPRRPHSLRRTRRSRRRRCPSATMCPRQQQGPSDVGAPLGAAGAAT